MIHGARGTESEAFAKNLIGPGRFIVRMQENMRVSLDEAGHQGGAGQIDDFRAIGGNARRRARGFDAVALDKHHPPFLHTVAIEDAHRFQQRLRGEKKSRQGEQNRDRDRAVSRHAAIISMHAGAT